MNVNVRQKPFQKRKPSPIAAQATGSAETFVRYVIARAIEQLERKRDAYAIALSKFPGDARLRTVIRATAEPPTDLSNTPALAVMGTDFVESLQPISAAAQLFRASRLMLVVRSLCVDQHSRARRPRRRAAGLGRRGRAGAGRRTDQRRNQARSVQAGIHRHRHPRDAARL